MDPQFFVAESSSNLEVTEVEHLLSEPDEATNEMSAAFSSALSTFWGGGNAPEH